MCGRPLGTGPRVETPCDSRSKIQLTAISPTTATRPPGIALIQRPKTIRIASTASETASVAPDVWPSSFSVSQNLIDRAARRGRATRSATGRRACPPTCPMRDLDPDAGQEADENGARDEVGEEAEPREAREQRGTPPRAARSGSRARATGTCTAGDPRCRAPAMPANMIAAVAESPPTTRCRDEPKIANARIGIRIVYRPGDHRRAGDLRVAHHLGDRERRERDPGDDVPREPRAVVRTDAPEQGHVAGQAPGCVGGLRGHELPEGLDDTGRRLSYDHRPPGITPCG